MTNKRWTQQEIEALKQMYPDENVSHEQMVEHFGRRWGTIKFQAQLRGLRRRASGLWTPTEVDDFIRMYPDEDIPREQIEQYFNRTWRSITGKAFNLKLYRPHPNPCNVVRDYFHVIDTDEKAYWLGFLAADGAVDCRGTRYYVRLDLQPRDLHWLTRFRDTVAPDASITKNGDRSYSVSIGSKEMVHDLMAVGIGPNKSNTLEWSNVPEAFVAPFLLGYFDGDGSFQNQRADGSCMWTLIGTLPFLTVARHYVQQCARIEIREPVRYSKTRCPHLYRMHAYGPRAIAIDRTLNASGLGLPRKHLPFDGA